MGATARTGFPAKTAAARRHAADRAAQRTAAAATANAQEGATAGTPRGFLELLPGLASENLDPSDPGHRDPEFIAAVAPFFQHLLSYFRVDVQGEKHLPHHGPFIVVGNHSGGPLLPDVWLKLAYWVKNVGAESPFYALVHDAPFRVPVLSNFLVKVGGMRASRENAEKVLDRGAPLLIYPGGEIECLRSFWGRNRLDFRGHTGFVALAYQYGVPIVPVVNVGGHEVYFTVFSSRTLARWTGMERFLRVKTLPLIVGLPWGVWLTGLVPYLPLPAKISYKIGRPIPFPRDPARARDPAALARGYARVTRTMRRMLADLAGRRRYPVIG